MEPVSRHSGCDWPRASSSPYLAVRMRKDFVVSRPRSEEGRKRETGTAQCRERGKILDSLQVLSLFWFLHGVAEA